MNSGMNPNVVAPGLDTTNYIADLLNKGAFLDPNMINFYINQCVSNIQNNFKLISILEQCRFNTAQIQAQQEAPTFNSCFSVGNNTPKASNIFAPKPLHAMNRVESTRIGRSHSMFVPNPIKPEVSTGDKSNGSDKHSEAVSQTSDKKELSDHTNSRKRMNVYRCPHTDRKHYAKNMCNNCYHKQGRNKKATKCPHRDRQNYAKGKCQNCYLNDYHKVKRRQRKEQVKEEASKEQEVDRRISVETSATEAAQEPVTPAVTPTQN